MRNEDNTNNVVHVDGKTQTVGSNSAYLPELLEDAGKI